MYIKIYILIFQQGTSTDQKVVLPGYKNIVLVENSNGACFLGFYFTLWKFFHGKHIFIPK